MVTQKPISVRLDNDVVYLLEQETFVSAYTKNRLINRAIRLYCAMVDTDRRYHMSKEGADAWEEIRKKLPGVPYI